MLQRVHGTDSHRVPGCSLVRKRCDFWLGCGTLILALGNLFTEKVTKRDIFYVFHKYGRVAQISMKSAYGFVQYHDSNACTRALTTEQGIELRGRKIRKQSRKLE